MSWVNSYEELLDFLSLVVVCAPDEFPKEDYLSDEQQLTLEMAFDEIVRGMEFVAKRVQDKEELARLQGYAAASLAAYRLGDDVKGAHLLQEFERELLKADA